MEGESNNVCCNAVSDHGVALMRKKSTLTLLAITLFAQVLTSCGGEMESSKNQKNDMPSGIAKVEIAGIKLDIPVAYFYWDKVRRGHWPTAQEERVKVGGFMLDMALPGFDGYSEANKQKFEEKLRDEVIVVGLGEWKNYMLPVAEIVKPLTKLESDPALPNFERYQGRSADTVRHIRPGDPHLVIDCVDRDETKGAQDSCNSRFKYDELEINIDFPRKHLGQWDVLFQGVIARIETWRVKGEK